MKRTLITLAASLSCLLISSTALTAQNVGWSYEIPFSFEAAGVQLPAGHYAVLAESETIGVLRGPNGSILFMRGPQLEAKPTTAHLTFRKSGNDYLLREVWDASGRGHQMPGASSERETPNTDQARVQPETVQLLASR